MDKKLQTIRQAFEGLDTVALCDASPFVRALTPGLRASDVAIKMVGRAFTVTCCNDYLSVIKALEEATEGDVLVVDGGRQSMAIFGELLAADAKRRGLAGAVIDGAVHHVEGIRLVGFPVYYRWTNPRAGRAAVVEPRTDVVSVCGVSVRRGDWMVGDADGVVIVPGDHAEEIIGVAREIKKVDAKVFESVKKGASLTEIMKFESFRREHDQEIRSRIESSQSESKDEDDKH